MITKFDIKTNNRNELIDISNEVKQSIKNSNIKNGIVLVYTPHTTTGITVNENADPDVKFDMTSFFNKLIPNLNSFKHNEGNSDSHIKSSVIGCSENFIISNYELILGTWQGIYFFEFDGPRHRNFYVKILEDN